MSIDRLKENFIRLSRHTKMIGLGSLILAISTFLPWYSDTDSYNIGYEFLGVTGPTSFIGISILLLAAASLWLFSYHLFERRVPNFSIREGAIHLFTSIQSIFLLVIVNSIYFNPRFGVNITFKESRFGMVFAFLGAIMFLAGAYIQNRDELAVDHEHGKLEPLIKLEHAKAEPAVSTPSKPVATLQSKQNASVLADYMRKHNMPVAPRPSQTTIGGQASEASEPKPVSALAKNFMFGDKAALSAKENAPKTEHKGIEEKKSDKEKKIGSYMIRMDL